MYWNIKGSLEDIMLTKFSSKLNKFTKPVIQELHEVIHSLVEKKSGLEKSIKTRRVDILIKKFIDQVRCKK